MECAVKKQVEIEELLLSAYGLNSTRILMSVFRFYYAKIRYAVTQFD